MARTRLSRWCLVGLLLCMAACGEIYTKNGTWYKVRSGDSVSKLAKLYRVKQNTIIAANHLDSPESIKVGQRLFIPAYRRGAFAKNDRKDTRVAQKEASKPMTRSPFMIESEEASFSRPVEGGEKLAFFWPIQGALTSKFGPRRGRRHDGVDISAPRGSAIYAAADGNVIFSDRFQGYGNMILIKHKNGYFTVYGHCARNLVKEGETIKRGQLIGRVGSTGRASGPHLHFEIRQGSEPRNPLAFLPKSADEKTHQGAIGGPE